MAACGAYVIFMTLNILGVDIAATFELIVTLLAIFELLVFMGVVAPGFSGATSPLTAGRARTASAAGAAGDVRRHSVRHLVLPRH